MWCMKVWPVTDSVQVAPSPRLQLPRGCRFVAECLFLLSSRAILILFSLRVIVKYPLDSYAVYTEIIKPTTFDF